MGKLESVGCTRVSRTRTVSQNGKGILCGSVRGIKTSPITMSTVSALCKFYAFFEEFDVIDKAT